MRRAAFSALISHWRKHPIQLVSLVLGLALATALWSGVQAINTEARASYDRAAGILGQDELQRLEPRAGTIPLSDYIAIRRAGWLVSPVMDGAINLNGSRVRLIGIDPLTTPPQSAPVDLSGDGDLQSFILDGLLFAHPDTAAQIPDTLPAVRATETLTPGVIITDLSTAADLLETDSFARLILAPAQPINLLPLSEVAPNLLLVAPDEGNDIARLTDSFHLNLTAFGLLSFGVGLFIVHAAIGLAFEQRRPLFRTLRALGLRKSTLLTLLATELLSLALIAGMLGVALGYLVAAALLPDVAATLRGLYGAQVSGVLTLNPAWWLSGLAIALLGTAVAGAQSLWRTAQLPILAPAQPRAWAIASLKSLKRQAFVGAGLIVFAALLATYGSGLTIGFVLLGCLLVGAALTLPLFLHLALNLASKFSRTALSDWTLADTRQQVPGLSLALMALLLAMAANIGVGTMVSSFRVTFTGWLDQRLAAQLYVTARDETEAEDLARLLDGQVDAILPIRYIDAQIEGAPGQIYGIIDDVTYRENWPLLAATPDVWDRLAAGDGALINEQLSLREDLAPGDPVTLGAAQFPVLGVYSDYGNPRGEAILSLAQLREQDVAINGLNFALRLPETRIEDVTNLLTNAGLPARNIRDQAAIKAFSLDVFERTFTVTGALNVLTLGVAALALLTSLLTLSTMRLPQLAPVWAMGLTRAKLARLELLRAVILAALTAFIALPVGLALAWVLLAIVNVEAFGWRLPMTLFPGDWIGLFLAALIAAALSAAWPARRLATRPAADLIKVFAHER
ncbi:ABC transporter permease [Cognatishimia sp. MH4019]|uniref:ABC transporter permease n=1 Tax=Cognatishimia sp. MH4019 TaxID=2854030 RepID=UPI001CD1A62D|nr:ABC transporter permease [Cognatishimia sp. MH4019]